MAAILARPCNLCGTTLSWWVNCRTKIKSTIWACEHCDVPCTEHRRCSQCVQVSKALRS